MDRRWHRRRGTTDPDSPPHQRLVTDGGEAPDDDVADGDADDDATDVGDTAEEPCADAPGDDSSDEPTTEPTDNEPTDPPGLDRSNVEVSEPGSTEPADPKWEKPDPEDIPEFEVAATEPTTIPDRGSGADDPTEGMPNTARSPEDTRIKSEETEGYIAALELCARLPEDARLPDDAADLVPVAVEAELEQDVQSFAAAEFDNPAPHVEVLEFVERDGEVWLRLRLGVPPEAFTDLDPAELRSHALQQVDGLL